MSDLIRSHGSALLSTRRHEGLPAHESEQADQAEGERPDDGDEGRHHVQASCSGRQPASIRSASQRTCTP